VLADLAAFGPVPGHLNGIRERLFLIARTISPQRSKNLRLSRFLVLGTMLIVGASAWADLRGAVINGTSKRPAAGDEVVLLRLFRDGMHEIARARTDSRGRFSLPVADPEATHVVRVIHQGVTYDRMAEPGVKALTVEVYEAATQLEGISAIMDVERFETTSDQLEVKQLITVRNASQPPRTLMNDRPFEIQLPPDAHVQSGLVQVGDGQPLKQKPVAAEQKGHYFFVFPVRPGDTRFAVVYRLPYDGKALIEPTIRNPLEKFVVMLPNSMQFEPKAAGVFHPMPGTTPDNVQGTEAATAEQTVAFWIKGKGTLEELEGRRHAEQADKTDTATRPGGGLGPPIEAPDPLQKYRWQVVAGLAFLLVSGAAYVVRKTRLVRAEGQQWVNRPVSVGMGERRPSPRRVNRRHRRRARA
jgi:5-hydroxyisourate hydrolase-like protein (transthyretin family)